MEDEGKEWMSARWRIGRVKGVGRPFLPIHPSFPPFVIGCVLLAHSHNRIFLSINRPRLVDLPNRQVSYPLHIARHFRIHFAWAGLFSSFSHLLNATIAASGYKIKLASTTPTQGEYLRYQQDTSPSLTSRHLLMLNSLFLFVSPHSRYHYPKHAFRSIILLCLT